MEFLKRLIFFKILILLSVEAYASDKIKRINFYAQNKSCEIKKNYLLLTDKKVNSLKEKFNLFELSSSIIKRFKYKCDTGQGHIYIMSDKVRTHFQTLVVDISNHKVKNVDILQFDEPLQYKAPNKWYEKLIYNKPVTEIKKIDGLTGATLTAKSTKYLISQILYLSYLDD